LLLYHTILVCVCDAAYGKALIYFDLSTLVEPSTDKKHPHVDLKF